MCGVGDTTRQVYRPFIFCLHTKLFSCLFLGEFAINCYYLVFRGTAFLIYIFKILDFWLVLFVRVETWREILYRISIIQVLWNELDLPSVINPSFRFEVAAGDLRDDNITIALWFSSVSSYVDEHKLLGVFTTTTYHFTSLWMNTDQWTSKGNSG